VAAKGSTKFWQRAYTRVVTHVMTMLDEKETTMGSSEIQESTLKHKMNCWPAKFFCAKFHSITRHILGLLSLQRFFF
jgi:hypothetical protein